MKRSMRKAFCMLTLLLLSSTFWTAIGCAATTEEIFVWVSRQMSIEYVYNMPEVRYVGKQQLQSVFQDYSRRSYARWQANHGEEQARIIMATYLNRVVGLFNPATRIIYVGAYLAPCIQQAVLAHEITHYFQHLTYGPIDPDGYGAEDNRMFREMEAYLIGNKFKELFCDSVEPLFDTSDRTFAFLY